MLELKIKAAGRRYVAPEGLRKALGAERAREKLADAIEALIAQMDLIDSDPDFEEDDLEDSFQLSERASSIATTCPAHDVEQDSGSWTEWHTRGRHKDSLGNVAANGRILHEDAEEDDAPEEDDHSGQCTEDEISSGLGHWGYTIGTSHGPGCTISDPDGEEYTIVGGGSAETGQERWEEVRPFYALEDAETPPDLGDPTNREIMRRTLKRIREERCVRVRSAWGGYRYRLVKPEHTAKALQGAANLT